MKKYKNLTAPSKYWDYINIESNKKVTCGPNNSSIDLVPDYLFGLNINEACSIHDYMYENNKDKNYADKIFLENMISIINENSKSIILKYLRIAKAYIYYFAVKNLGSSFYRASHAQQKEKNLI